jgi:mono/diheme cytochrome c family protein
MIRWIPFILLILSAIGFSVYFFFSGRISGYKPKVNDSAVIYQEACADCHGKTGAGEGLFYPGLLDTSLTRRDVVEAIREGRFMMPAFTEIPDSTLRDLVRYVLEKRFDQVY